MSYDNTNRGAIWQNKEKQKDTQPDFKGSLNVNGIEFWVSAWKRKPESNPNSPALSFSVEPKEQQGFQPAGNTGAPAQQRTTARSPAPPSAPDDFDDDIPFN